MNYIHGKARSILEDFDDVFAFVNKQVACKQIRQVRLFVIFEIN